MTTADSRGVEAVPSARYQDGVTGAVSGILRRRPLLFLGLAFIAILILSLLIGRYPAPYLMSPAALWQDDMARQLVLNLRLPRVLTACLLGMTLSVCGTVLQMIFRNPLVEPGFLGVSQGAVFAT